MDPDGLTSGSLQADDRHVQLAYFKACLIAYTHSLWGQQGLHIITFG